MPKQTCPRVRFVREDLGNHASISAHTGKPYAPGSRKVGLVTIRNKLSIGFIEISEDMRRCGLGTRLYEKAAKIACTEGGSGLRSDIERTAASQNFWEKQVRKGRATCTELEPAPSGRAEDNESIVGRGGCYFYTLKCPAPKSLAGRRQRRQR